MGSSIWQDVRTGWRLLRKSPGFTVVAVLSMALGIGANVAIFSVINGVFLHPLAVEEPARLAEIFTRDNKTVQANANFQLTASSLPNYEDFRDQNRVYSGLAAATPFSFPLTWGGRAAPEQLNAVLTSANFFDVLGVKAYRGRMFFSEEDKKPGANAVAVLSYSLWTRKFGSDQSLIGQAISLNGTSYTVIGVAPPNFKGTQTLNRPDLLWVPLSMRDFVLSGQVKALAANRRFRWLSMVGRLKAGVSVPQAQAAMKTIASALEQQYPKENLGRTVEIFPLNESALGINQRHQFSLIGAVLMGVVGVVLMIACVNLASLLLTQGARREKELSIRVALGAGRARLLRQLLTESILLSLLGGVAGLLVAFWGRKVLWAFRPPFLQDGAVDLSFDTRVFGFALGVSLLTGLLFGIIPAIKSSDPDVNASLKIGGRGGAIGWTHSRIRSLLVVSEIALAVVALIGAGLFLRSLQNALKLNPGFESKNLFQMRFDLASVRYDREHGQQFFREAIQRAKSVHGVVDATVSFNGILAPAILITVYREGQQVSPDDRGTLVTLNNVTPGYFDALRIPILRGRDFTEFDGETSKPVVVINEAMAKLVWPGEEALGKRFVQRTDTTLVEVVGVVGTTAVGAIGENPQPVAYFPLRQQYVPGAVLIVRTTARPETVLSAVRSRVQELERGLALTNVQTVEEVLGVGLWAPRMGAALLGLFGVLALVLASIGIYGVLAYWVAQRTSEIGVRMALGAQRLQMLGLVLKNGMSLAAIGAGLGIVAALLIARTISSLLYGVSVTDPLTYAGITALLLGVALLACYVPARRAARLDPLRALRYE